MERPRADSKPSSLQPCQSLQTHRESRSQASHLTYLRNIISAWKWDGFGEMSECVCKPTYFTVNKVLCCSLSSTFIVSFSQHRSAAHPWDAKSHVRGNRRKCDGGDAPKTHEKMVKIWSVYIFPSGFQLLLNHHTRRPFSIGPVSRPWLRWRGDLGSLLLLHRTPSISLNYLHGSLCQKCFTWLYVSSHWWIQACSL